MYREWTRDFRRCIDDCQEAISHLKKGTLSQWYGLKLQDITNLAKGMLSGSQGPDKANQIRDTSTRLTIPSVLVTMKRFGTTTNWHSIEFATPRIAQIIADVQETGRWTNSWKTLSILFRNPETRVPAGKLFQRMFLAKFRKQDPNTMPPCYKLHLKDGPYPYSDSSNTAIMPWNGLRQQSTPNWISIGKDTDGSLYSKKELRAAIEAVILKPGDPPTIRFLIPCGENWASWDAALFIGERREDGLDVNIVFLQLTVDPNHTILAKGLNQVRDAIPQNLNGVRVRYHYILVLLTQYDQTDGLKIPLQRPVLKNSRNRERDDTWDMNTLTQYIMFVPRTALAKLSSEG